MSAPLLRPEAVATLRRWQEVLTGLAIAAVGLWVGLSGGWFFGAVGVLAGMAGLGLAVIGVRRLRFRPATTGIGAVDVLEGQIAYLSPLPERGGFASIPEITSLSLVLSDEGRAWRIGQAGAAPLVVPVDARGAERLYDVFATLPGLHLGAVLAALERSEGDVLIWRRPVRQVTSKP
ncbi:MULTISPECIES: hypothetical protein [unclassified Haematobacter]|uniref:hypothetical protein n=1 Tax=unclassified Haematobacter TaxID=2640585 RepID=UPI0025B935E5|nr:MULTISPECIES: hypothetical protein [unclassified Haematobacter]